MNIYINPGLKLERERPIAGSIGRKSPANIALVKYRGKQEQGQQLPMSPSLSFTLSNAFTQTTLTYTKKEQDDDQIALVFLFEGKEKPSFETKIKKYFTHLLDIFPFLLQLNIRIESSNSFPHSSGIASSASSMSSLALCLCSLERDLFDIHLDEQDFLQKVSYIARLGSGSASRSVFPKAALRGKMEGVSGSSDFYAISAEQYLHKSFDRFHDDILLVSKNTKSVSSSAGHVLMNNHPYKDARIVQANERMQLLLAALKVGDIEIFGMLVEADALSLHALMMSSEPGYLLMEAGTLEIIKLVRTWREETKIPVYFSLDAGPNVHILYPDTIAVQVKQFIKKSLLVYCKDGMYIEDGIGGGAEEMEM